MFIKHEDGRRHQRSQAHKLDEILDDFEARTPQPMGRNLRHLLESSPYLKDQFSRSAEHGLLRSIRLLPPEEHAGATFSPGSRAISVPGNLLLHAGNSRHIGNELTFLLGHEIQHSFNNHGRDNAEKRCLARAERIARSPGPHDYTSVVAAYIDAARKDEAGANLAGFNALSSRLVQANGHASLRDLYNASPGRMEDFIDRRGHAPFLSHALKPGLSLNANLMFDQTRQNISAMGRYYFDRPPHLTGLGRHGNQDYRHYCAQDAFDVIHGLERRVQREVRAADPGRTAPEVRINLRALGLDAALIETPLKFRDSSAARRQDRHADNSPDASPIGFDGSLRERVAGHLSPLRGSAGLHSSLDVERVAMAIATDARRHGMSDVDGIVRGVSGNLIAYQGDPASEASKRFSIDPSFAATYSLHAGDMRVHQPVAQPEPALPPRR
jgi:hypothetical protein